MSNNSNLDPNAHAEALAKLLHKMTSDAEEQANATRMDPNYLAQSLESNGDPTTMPKLEGDEVPEIVQEVTESPNEAAEKLEKELNKAIAESTSINNGDKSAIKPEEQHVEPYSLEQPVEEKIEEQPEDKPEDNSENKNESSSDNNETSPEEKPEQEHVDTKEALTVEFEPPQGTVEGQDSSWERPDAPTDWHEENNGEPGPEGNWPSAVYDPNNPQGTEVTEGTSSATDAPADWGTYDDNIYSAKKNEKNEEKQENEKQEPEKDVGGGADGDENTWDHDDDPSTPEIVIKGAKFGKDHPKKEDVRTQDVIVAHHIDHKRDDKLGVSLSNYNLNYVFAEPDERDHKFRAVFGAPDVNYLPATSDLRPNWGSILDQLDLGSCVSNSVSYCIRYCFKKQKLGDFTPSRLFIYFNGRQIAGYPINEDTGLTIRDGYKSVTRFSACSEQNWPYLPNKFSTRPPETCYVAAQQHKTFRYISLDNDLAQIKKCLKDGFPVSFGAALFESFMSTKVAQTGIVPMPNAKREQRCGGHAMTIIGHDDAKKAFLVVNNWGEKWGIKGCCWMPYDYIANDDWTGDLWSPRYFGA